MTAGIVLAAGQGRRFGSQKLLREVGGRTLLASSVGAAVASALGEILVVLPSPPGALDEEIARCFPNEPRIRRVRNEHPERGMMGSVKAGLRALGPEARAAMVILADMPYVTGEIIDALLEAHERTDGAVIPVCGGERRHPRLIPARMFPDFLGLGDDAAGNDVFERHACDVEELNIGMPEDYIDMDVPGDLAAGRGRSADGQAIAPAGRRAPHNAGEAPSNN